MIVVVDASVLVSALLHTSADLAERLILADTELHAPHLIDLEAASVLRKLTRLERLTDRQAEQALDDLGSLALTRYPHTALLDRVWALRRNLSPYDAAYVALAEALDAPLLTRDQRLARAPGHKARVEVV